MRKFLIIIAVLLVAAAGTAVAVSQAAPSVLPSGVLATATQTGLDVGLRLRRAARAPLRGAGASELIQVPAGAPIGGYLQLRTRRSKAAGRVEATALAVAAAETSVVVTGLDAVTISPQLLLSVSSRISSASRLVMTATHTHSGPGGFGACALAPLFLGGGDAELLETIVTAQVQAASRALEHMRPVSLHHTSVPAHDLVVNRSERGAAIDSSVDIVELRRGGSSSVRLVTFGAHPTLVRQRTRIDGDYPSALRRALRERGDKTTTLFAAAATGSASARRMGSAEDDVAFGQELAKIVAGVSLQSSGRSAALAVERVHVSMPPPHVPLVAGRVLRQTPSAWVTATTLPVDLIRLGPVLIAVLPGELSGEVSGRLRQRFRDHGLQLVIASHNGVYAGYFMPPARYGHPGPEAALELYGPGAASVMTAFLNGVRQGLVAGAP